MEKTIAFSWGTDRIWFSDLDTDGDIEIVLTDGHGDDTNTYLTPDNIRALKQHLDYLVGKLDDIEFNNL